MFTRARARAHTHTHTHTQEKKDFLDALGVSDSNSVGLNALVRASYKLLGLLTYFTTGPTETRAWTITQVFFFSYFFTTGLLVRDSYNLGLLTYLTTRLTETRAWTDTKKGFRFFFSLLYYRALRCYLLQDAKCACVFSALLL